MPPGSPVDVQFIGHSEGAVVNSETILRLNAQGWPAGAQAGYLKVTMIDPHAANNNIKAPQYSVSNGVLGQIARMMINDYQSKAKDPLPVVTPNVQDAEVFYQHTPVSKTFGSNGGIYNLWGQVPVQGSAHYYDLTAPGISHGGKFGIQDWYRLNVVPTLGTGGTQITTSAVTGALQPGGTSTPNGRREKVDYAGTAAANVTVHLWAGLPTSSKVIPIGKTYSSADGTWRITTRALAPASYRVVATTAPPHGIGPHHTRVYYRPTAWLGTLTIPPRRPVV
jgi:hypothetical protein